MNFLETTHLSQIIEESDKHPVIIFKYSNECASSTDLKKKMEFEMSKQKIKSPVYLVTVQIQKVLSGKIEEAFGIKHESPQIIILNKNKVTYTASHLKINIPEFKFT